METSVISIHTSDRASFKRCRRRWDYTSPMRQNLQPKVSSFGVQWPLWFGTGIHKVLETHYTPKGASRLAPMWQVWQEWYVSELVRIEMEAPGYYQENMETFDSYLDLGLGMMRFYEDYSKRNDTFRLVEPEHDFSVPLDMAYYNHTGVFLTTPVMYEGRMDSLIEDEHGRLGILETKTASRIDEDYLAKLDMDEQVTCVPLDTEALTPAGWKEYSELSVGDLVLAYNQDHNLTVWSPIRAISKFKDAPVVELHNTRGDFRVRCTPNHAWIGRRYVSHDEYAKWIPWRPETQQLPACHGKLILSAPCAHSGTSDISPSDAALLAWIVTDGSVGHYKRTLAVTINQTKYVQEIQDLVDRLQLKATVSTVLTANSGEVNYTWRFSAPEMRAFFAKVGFESKESLSSIVLGMSYQARRAFIDTGILAEGSARQRTFHQLDGPVADAYRLAFFLEGYFPTQGNGRGFGYTHPERDTRTLLTSEPVREDVWCLQTDEGSWVMRQGNHISITGNSYLWAAQQENPDRKAEFVLYNILLKGYPKPPVTLANGKLSVDRTQTTSLSHFVERAKELQLVGTDWWESDRVVAYREHLAEQGDELYIVRKKVLRNQWQIENCGKRIVMETEDMLNVGDHIYPNPTGNWDCIHCPFRAPCLMTEDGSDPSYTLEENYERRA